MWNVKRIIQRIRLVPFTLVAILLCSCEVDESLTLEALVIDNVTANTIDCSVTISGTSIPIDCGFYYGTSKNDVEKWGAEKAKGLFLIDRFSGTIENLNPNTTYYIRAYAMNIRGREHTETLEVKTLTRAPEYNDNNYPGIVFKE